MGLGSTHPPTQALGKSLSILEHSSHLAKGGHVLTLMGTGGWGTLLGTVPGPVGHLSFNDILDTSLKVSWQEPGEKNGILTGRHADAPEPKGGAVGSWGYPLSVPCLQPAPVQTTPLSHTLNSSFVLSICPTSQGPFPNSVGPQGLEDLKGLSVTIRNSLCLQSLP